MKKAVIYARYSSHKQREESIERQLEICHQFAKDRNYEVIAEYCDRAQTGKNDNRPAFQKMICDAKNKQFEVVIVWKQDRFARNRFDSATYKGALAAYKVRVFSATEPVPEGSSGILVESIFEGMAEAYSAELSEKVMDGMKRNAKNGTVNGGYRLFGYDIVEKRYVINTYEAEIVKRVFEKYANGDTVRSIIEHCCERGYKTPQATDFGYNFLNRMLKNKKYIGLYSWGDIEQTDIIEPIIEKRLFDRVQKRLEQDGNTGARNNAVEEYVLSGKAFCGHCEQPLTADSVTKTVKSARSTSPVSFNLHTYNNISNLLSEDHSAQSGDPNKRVYRYYVCRGTKQKAFLNGCKKKRVDKDKFEDAVIAYTAKQYLSDKNIDELAKAIYKVQRRVTSNPNIKEIEYKILEEAKKIENLYVMVESGHFTNKVFERIEQAELRKEDYEAELKRLRTTMPKLTIEQVKEKLIAVREKMQNFIAWGKIPLKVKKAFCDAFIEKVYLFDEDDGGDGGNDKKMKCRIVFDAFESEGLLGFDDAEIELSSIFESVGSPKNSHTIRCGSFLLYGNRKAGTSPQTGVKSVRWTLFRPWEIPPVCGRIP